MEFVRGTIFAQMLRWQLSEAQNHRCCYCGDHMDVEPKFKNGGSSTKMATLEHVVARNAGGSTTWDNTVAACSDCNNQRPSAMNAMDYFESGLWDRRRPNYQRDVLDQRSRMRRLCRLLLVVSELPEFQGVDKIVTLETAALQLAHPERNIIVERLDEMRAAAGLGPLPGPVPKTVKALQRYVRETKGDAHDRIGRSGSYRRTDSRLRIRLSEAQNHRCPQCGTEMELHTPDSKRLAMLYPAGGEWTWEGLVVICGQCDVDRRRAIKLGRKQKIVRMLGEDPVVRASSPLTS